MIVFNKPPFTGNEQQYVLESLQSLKLSGNGMFTLQCHRWFEEKLGCSKALLTPSCTHALEMTAILIDIRPGDEVIMPSYTFVSTANAFALRGAKIVFVDIRPDTMNIDESLIEKAITPQTKAIVAVHYLGAACEMDTIMQIAKRHDLVVIEDAAQAMMSQYKGRALGTIGHLATFSFHETKNYTSGGEGGLLIINDAQYIPKAEIIREKGTDRQRFFRGMVDKYSWIDIGSSYRMSDLNAAYLWGQLQVAEEIKQERLKHWHLYDERFRPMAQEGLLEVPTIPKQCTHNGHMYYIKVKDLEDRGRLIEYLKYQGIQAVFHYVPLHRTPGGEKFGSFFGEDRYTTKESERVVRLPLYYGITPEEITQVIDAVTAYITMS